MSETELHRLVAKLQSLNVEFMLLVKAEQVSVWSAASFPRNQRKQIKDIAESQHESGNTAVLDIRPLLTTQKTLNLARNCRQNHELLVQYEIILNSLTQTVCKTLAKEWIKVIEPRKQATYPYKMNNVPPWWPKAVPHVEPDHLEKKHRISLLIAILRIDSVDIRSLKRAANNIVSPFEYTHPLLYELFYIALYERFFFGYGRSANDDLWAELTDDERIWLDLRYMNLPVSDLSQANKITQNSNTYSNPVIVRQYAADHFNTETVPLCQCFSVDDFSSPQNTSDSDEALFVVADPDIKHEYAQDLYFSSEQALFYNHIIEEHTRYFNKRIRLASPALYGEISDSPTSRASDFDLSLVCSSATSN